jgi:hypothetical protein
LIDKKQTCQKIREIYQDIRICGIDIQVDYDAVQKRWVIAFGAGFSAFAELIEFASA